MVISEEEEGWISVKMCEMSYKRLGLIKTIYILIWDTSQNLNVLDVKEV